MKPGNLDKAQADKTLRTGKGKGSAAFGGKGDDEDAGESRHSCARGKEPGSPKGDARTLSKERIPTRGGGGLWEVKRHPV
jgi:hypothetical protein